MSYFRNLWQWCVSVPASTAGFSLRTLVQVSRQRLDLCAWGELYQSRPCQSWEIFLLWPALWPAMWHFFEFSQQALSKSSLTLTSRIWRGASAQRSLYPCWPDSWVLCPRAFTESLSHPLPCHDSYLCVFTMRENYWKWQFSTFLPLWFYLSSHEK